MAPLWLQHTIQPQGLLDLIEDCEFHIHRHNVAYGNTYYAVCLPCCSAISFQPRGLPGTLGPCARTEDTRKALTDTVSLFLLLCCRYNDPLAQTCVRWQLETGHISETTGPERRKWRNAMTSLSQEVAIFRFPRNNRQTHLELDL